MSIVYLLTRRGDVKLLHDSNKNDSKKRLNTELKGHSGRLGASPRECVTACMSRAALVPLRTPRNVTIFVHAAESVLKTSAVKFSLNPAYCHCMKRAFHVY
uniref:Uncharacterized protein n=1 Tax=Echeneis naucrates TaxID=173247 RepID=A0A665V044_ECHNA